VERATVTQTVAALWADEVLPSLSELVAIPAVSQAFDPDWAAHGHVTAAVEHVRTWLLGQGLPGATAEVFALGDTSPMLVFDVPGEAGAGTVLLYGHLDKQPPAGQWSDGLDPWTPVVRDGKLYGRGAADDGYAAYASVAAIKTVRAAGGRHARCVLMLETAEESGSPGLSAYLDHIAPRLGEDVSLIVCLDAIAADYDRMWLITSLRGLVQTTVTAHVLDTGQHSGTASGVVPSSFRVLRQLLDRVEDAATGQIRLPELHVAIPEHRIAETKDSVVAAPGMVYDGVPISPGMSLVSDDEAELALNSTWRPTMSVIGADGLPTPANAGNVLRPFTTLCLSFRLPPTADSAAAQAAIATALTTDVPYGAKIELSRVETADGWNAPDFAPWLRTAIDDAADTVFGQPWRTIGMGGSVPVVGELHKRYPKAQFIVTGVLGPGSNAHVPDEFLHLEYAHKVTETIALLLNAHAIRNEIVL
jgi:acetylornithine deacetylase/succinyl-diaminopimelate desuccinylase-like protein